MASAPHSSAAKYEYEQCGLLDEDSASGDAPGDSTSRAPPAAPDRGVVIPSVDHNRIASMNEIVRAAGGAKAVSSFKTRLEKHQHAQSHPTATRSGGYTQLGSQEPVDTSDGQVEGQSEAEKMAAELGLDPATLARFLSTPESRARATAATTAASATRNPRTGASATSQSDAAAHASR